ncbi:MAG: glycosyltransferase 87 family protein [Pseudomonadota bacterium]
MIEAPLLGNSRRAGREATITYSDGAGASITARLAPWSLIAAGLVLLAAYPLARGDGVDRVLAYDARYLHAAGHCLWQGLSPYDLGAFRGCWEAVTGEGLHSSFVLPPVSFVLALPMGLLPWAEAEVLFDSVQIAACIALALVLAELAGMGDSAAPRHRLFAAIWVALALISHGVIVTIIVGQYVVFTALGIGLLVLGHNRQSGWRMALGTLLVLWKPHLALLVLALAWLWGPLALWRWKLGVVAVLAAIAIALFLFDPAVVTHYQGSMGEHLRNAHTNLAREGALTGLPGVPDLLARAAPLLVYGLLGALAAYLLVTVLLVRSVVMQGERYWAVFGAAIVLGVFLVPHKIYDFAAMAPAIALLGRMPWRVQVLGGLAFWIVWRPNLAISIGGMAIPLVEMLNLGILAFGLMFVIVAVLAPARRRAA